MKQALIEVRNSPVHGSGVFALRKIRKGSTIIEYLGDRVSPDEADAQALAGSQKSQLTVFGLPNV